MRSAFFAKHPGEYLSPTGSCLVHEGKVYSVYAEELYRICYPGIATRVRRRTQNRMIRQCSIDASV